MASDEQVDWQRVSQQMREIAEQAIRQCWDKDECRNEISAQTMVEIMEALTEYIRGSSDTSRNVFVDGFAIDRLVLPTGEPFRIRVFWEKLE